MLIIRLITRSSPVASSWGAFLCLCKHNLTDWTPSNASYWADLGLAKISSKKGVCFTPVTVNSPHYERWRSVWGMKRAYLRRLLCENKPPRSQITYNPRYTVSCGNWISRHSISFFFPAKNKLAHGNFTYALKTSRNDVVSRLAGRR